MVNLPEILFNINGIEMRVVPWNAKKNHRGKQGERGRGRSSAVGPARLVSDGGKALRK